MAWIMVSRIWNFPRRCCLINPERRLCHGELLYSNHSNVYMPPNGAAWTCTSIARLLKVLKVLHELALLHERLRWDAKSWCHCLLHSGPHSVIHIKSKRKYTLSLFKMLTQTDTLLTTIGTAMVIYLFISSVNSHTLPLASAFDLQQTWTSKTPRALRSFTRCSLATSNSTVSLVSNNLKGGCASPWTICDFSINFGPFIPSLTYSPSCQVSWTSDQQGFWPMDVLQGFGWQALSLLQSPTRPIWSIRSDR